MIGLLHRVSGNGIHEALEGVCSKGRATSVVYAWKPPHRPRREFRSAFCRADSFLHWFFDGTHCSKNSCLPGQDLAVRQGFILMCKETREETGDGQRLSALPVSFFLPVLRGISMSSRTSRRTSRQSSCGHSPVSQCLSIGRKGQLSFCFWGRVLSSCMSGNVRRAVAG